jgi:hypothetical protein
MIDNDQSTIIEAPEVYISPPTHSPTAKPTPKCTRKNDDFDTFDGATRFSILCAEYSAGRIDFLFNFFITILQQMTKTSPKNALLSSIF